MPPHDHCDVILFLCPLSCVLDVAQSKSKGKGKLYPKTGHAGPEREEMYSYTLPATSALDGGGWSTPRPCRFTPGKDSVPIIQEAGWAPGPVCTGAENFAPTGIRSPHRPARSKSPYRLRYLVAQGKDKLSKPISLPIALKIFTCGYQK